MTIIKRKTFIIKHFARFAEQTDLQKKTKYCDVSASVFTTDYYSIFYR